MVALQTKICHIPLLPTIYSLPVCKIHLFPQRLPNFIPLQHQLEVQCLVIQNKARCRGVSSDMILQVQSLQCHFSDLKLCELKIQVIYTQARTHTHTHTQRTMMGQLWKNHRCSYSKRWKMGTHRSHWPVVILKSHLARVASSLYSLINRSPRLSAPRSGVLSFAPESFLPLP